MILDTEYIYLIQKQDLFVSLAISKKFIMGLVEEFNKLMQVHWQFLHMDWPIITKLKYHCTEVKNIPSIEHVKDVILQKLGIITVFFFLTQLFGTHDYPGAYRNIEKGLLLLYHIIEGKSIMDMSRFIPKSSF